jgi:hypothetical protein
MPGCPVRSSARVNPFPDAGMMVSKSFEVDMAKLALFFEIVARLSVFVAQFIQLRQSCQQAWRNARRSALPRGIGGDYGLAPIPSTQPIAPQLARFLKLRHASPRRSIWPPRHRCTNRSNRPFRCTAPAALSVEG